MPTLECLDKNTAIDFRDFPCPNSHRPILHDLLSLFDKKEFKQIQESNSILIACVLTKIYRLNGNQLDNGFRRCLSIELGVSENYKFSSKLDGLLNYEIFQLEELISIIFQTKSLRNEGHKNGSVTRKQGGIFHTPYPIATLIAKEAIDLFTEKLFWNIKNCKDKKTKELLYSQLLGLKIIDPACGTGIILSATIDYLASINDKLEGILAQSSCYKPRNEFIKTLIANGIFGVDIDKEATRVVRALFKAKYRMLDVDLSNNIKSGSSISTGDLFSNTEFSYEHEFENTFSNNRGFDILVMNPPYERLKVDRPDFKEINDKDILYKTNKQNVNGFVSAIKESKCYPLSDEGVLDLYKLFIDRATQITNEKGIISFIVPLSLLGDRSCRKIRGYIFDFTSVGNIYCIPENAKAFHGVSQAFCVVGFKKSKTKNTFYIYEDTINVEPLQYAKRISVNISDIKQICPLTYSIPICDKKGWEILKAIHKFPALSEVADIINLRGEVDLTFGAKYVTSDPREDLLIRGNAIDLYGIKKGENNKDSYVMLSKMKNDKFGGMKLHYVNSERLVGQQIVNMGVKKRLKFALIQKGVVANSCNFITLKKENHNNLLFLLGILNSSILNWRFKLTSTNNHVNNYELDELPIVNSGKHLDVFKSKIAKEVSLQCRAYLEERQLLLDVLVSLSYGLTLDAILYIARKDGMTKEHQAILEKAYNREKSTL